MQISINLKEENVNENSCTGLKEYDLQLSDADT